MQFRTCGPFDKHFPSLPAIQLHDNPLVLDLINTVISH